MNAQSQNGTSVIATPARFSEVASPKPPPAPDDLADLVLKMRAGDRDAAARFIAGYGPLIRRRVRGKLGPSMRRLFDSMEILSTLSRRLDRYVRAGRVRAATEPEFWMLVFKMVDAAMIDRIRLTKRLKSVEGEDSDFARCLLSRLESRADAPGGDAIEAGIDAVLRSLPTAADRQILSLWLMGNSGRVIADCLSISHDALRQRWQAIRDRLRARVEAGDF